MNDFQFLDYSVDANVALIVLNSPNEQNTQSVASVAEWVVAIEKANADSAVGAIVITAKGKAFSAGGDMDELFLPKSRGDEPYEDDDPYTGGLGLFSTDWVELLRHSKPIVVAFNGYAVGGGITFFLPADVLVASERASFHFTFVKVGIVPEICSTKYLPARVGFGRASEIILTGRAVAAQEAFNIGLVDYLVPAEELLDKALTIAKTIAANPTPMLKLSKQLLDQNCLEQDDSKVWRRESDGLRKSFSLPEHQDAVAKFIEKK
jgi:enoyl-CoA hydratase/carnithine racemase